MQLIRTAFHPEVSEADIATSSGLTLIERHAARAIVLDGDNILLLYTQRYHDYSLPGGGIDDDEDDIAGLTRELQEETGAHGVCNITPFVSYEEYRPWHKPDADIIHMISRCYTCEIDKQLGEPALEAYELDNGMSARWMNIHEAIAHNEEVLAHSDKKGLSIDRETFLLKAIVDRLLPDNR